MVAKNSTMRSRFEVQGSISSMAYGRNDGTCLVNTIMNGAHIFHTNDTREAGKSVGSTLTYVESFPHTAVGDEPMISSSFASYDSCFAVGSSKGGISLISRQSKKRIKHITLHEGFPVLSLAEIPQEPSLLLGCSPSCAQVIDLEVGAVRMNLHVLKPKIVGAVAVSNSILAVPNYDGKVVMYDVRKGNEPTMLLSISDQITSIAASPVSGSVVAGTVSGRVFVMRCLEGCVREEAFSTGAARAPIRSLATRDGFIAAGDTSARLTYIDTRDNPRPTVHWDSMSLLPPKEAGATGVVCGEHDAKVDGEDEGWSVTAVAMREGDIWAALSSPQASVSHVTVFSI